MSVDSRNRLLEELKDKDFRDAYISEHVKTSVPLQLRAIRENKFEWSQAELADHAKTKQSAISRLEDTDYGNLSINNLLKIVSAFDVALLVKVVSVKRLLEEFEDLSPRTLSDVKTFEEELPALEEWATENETQQYNVADVRKVLVFPTVVPPMSDEAMFPSLQTRPSLLAIFPRPGPISQKKFSRVKRKPAIRIDKKKRERTRIRGAA